MIQIKTSSYLSNQQSFYDVLVNYKIWLVSTGNRSWTIIHKEYKNVCIYIYIYTLKTTQDVNFQYKCQYTYF